MQPEDKETTQQRTHADADHTCMKHAQADSNGCEEEHFNSESLEPTEQAVLNNVHCSKLTPPEIDLSQPDNTISAISHTQQRPTEVLLSQKVGSETSLSKPEDAEPLLDASRVSEDLVNGEILSPTERTKRNKDVIIANTTDIDNLVENRTQTRTMRPEEKSQQIIEHEPKDLPEIVTACLLEETKTQGNSADENHNVKRSRNEQEPMTMGPETMGQLVKRYRRMGRFRITVPSGILTQEPEN